MLSHIFTNGGDMSEFSIFLAGMLAVAMTLGAIGAASTPTPNSTTLLSAVSAKEANRSE